MTHGSALLLMLIAYIHCVYIMKRYRVGFGRTDRKLASIGACLNLNVSLLGVRCTMAPSQLHIRLLFNYNGNGNDMLLCTHADVD